VYTGDGQGHFTHTFSIAVGISPTGLNVLRNPQTGFLDLLVGGSGDVLRLQGKGDGTFQFPGRRVSLAVQDLKGDGRPEVLVANQRTDRITIQAAAPGTPRFAPVVTLDDGTRSTLAPGDVQWARLEGPDSPFFDAVVVASGGNQVLVYHFLR